MKKCRLKRGPWTGLRGILLISDLVEEEAPVKNNKKIKEWT